LFSIINRGTKMLRTKLCDILGIEYPIIQAGMGFVAKSELAAAVSNAGALGVIGGAEASPEELRREIRRVRELTDKPFGVDLLMVEGFKYAWEDFEIVLEEKPPVFLLGLGIPEMVVPKAHEVGMKVISLAGKVKHAIRAERAGVDIIVAQGTEAGGHTGSIGTMALVPQVVDAVEAPVVAAGGIGDGRGLVAALALGACGVLIGTRFACSEESQGHINYKKGIVRATEEDAVITKAYSGKTARCLNNRFIEEWKKREDEILPPLQQIELMRDKIEGGMVGGNLEWGCCPAGQISGMFKDIKKVKEIIEDIIQGAERIMHSFTEKGVL